MTIAQGPGGYFGSMVGSYAPMARGTQPTYPTGFEGAPGMGQMGQIGSMIAPWVAGAMGLGQGGSQFNYSGQGNMSGQMSQMQRGRDLQRAMQQAAEYERANIIAMTKGVFGMTADEDQKWGAAQDKAAGQFADKATQWAPLGRVNGTCRSRQLLR